jgi:hypothetical protein
VVEMGATSEEHIVAETVTTSPNSTTMDHQLVGSALAATEAASGFGAAVSATVSQVRQKELRSG